MITLIKIGGSLITDKNVEQSFRPEVMTALAHQIATVVRTQQQQLIVGHGSGSFGHMEASRHHTMAGVSTADQWLGFCRVAAAAAMLNERVMASLLALNVPALSFQPSATLQADNGRVTSLTLTGLSTALAHGLVPVVYGDVAFDTTRGGTIASTESLFTYLVSQLEVTTIILLGEVDGVLDSDGHVIPHLTNASIDRYRHVLGGSAGTDVTGGMLTKVTDMLALAAQYPALRIHIINGLRAHSLHDALLGQSEQGTLITA